MVFAGVDRPANDCELGPNDVGDPPEGAWKLPWKLLWKLLAGIIGGAEEV